MSAAKYLSAIGSELAILLDTETTIAAAVAAATAPLNEQIASLQQDASQVQDFVAKILPLLPPVVLTVAVPTVTASIGGPVTGTPVTASGGSGAITLEAAGLPDGVVLDPSTGALSGLSSVAGTGVVTVTATDSVGNTATATFTLTVA